MTDYTDYIEKDIIVNATIREGIHLYAYNDAIKLVTLCEQNGLSILGIDSFIVTEKETLPYMEHSIDYSNTMGNESVFKLAKNFLEDKKKYGFLFEIVY